MRDSRPVHEFKQFRPQPLRLHTEEAQTVLPPNPAIMNGMRVLYLGTSRKRIEGPDTGYVYHAGPERRDLVVDRADLDAVLKNRAFVLA